MGASPITCIPLPPRSRSKNNGTEHDGGMHKDEKQALKMKPRAAGVPSKFSSADFVGCCYDENGVCYVVTSTGTLCSVDSNKMMNKWVELDTSSCHSLSITRSDTSSKKGLLTIGCGQAVVRMFRPGTLQYVTTLPILQTNPSASTTA